MTAELTLQEQIAELQRQLEQKQQEAHDAKIKRQVELQNALRAAQDELDELEAEIGIETQQRPIVRQQTPSSNGGLGRGRSSRGYGGWGKACIEVLQRSGKQMTAGEVGAAIHAPKGGANVATYLRPFLEHGSVVRTGSDRYYKYQWVGGAQ